MIPEHIFKNILKQLYFSEDFINIVLQYFYDSATIESNKNVESNLIQDICSQLTSDSSESSDLVSLSSADDKNNMLHISIFTKFRRLLDRYTDLEKTLKDYELLKGKLQYTYYLESSMLYIFSSSKTTNKSRGNLIIYYTACVCYYLFLNRNSENIEDIKTHISVAWIDLGIYYNISFAYYLKAIEIKNSIKGSPVDVGEYYFYISMAVEHNIEEAIDDYLPFLSFTEKIKFLRNKIKFIKAPLRKSEFCYLLADHYFKRVKNDTIAEEKRNTFANKDRLTESKVKNLEKAYKYSCQITASTRRSFHMIILKSLYIEYILTDKSTEKILAELKNIPIDNNLNESQKAIDLALTCLMQLFPNSDNKKTFNSLVAVKDLVTYLQFDKSQIDTTFLYQYLPRIFFKNPQLYIKYVQTSQSLYSLDLLPKVTGVQKKDFRQLFQQLEISTMDNCLLLHYYNHIILQDLNSKSLISKTITNFIGTLQEKSADYVRNILQHFDTTIQVRVKDVLGL